MAIPGSSAPNLMAPALAGPSLGNGPLPLPGQRDPWTYMVSPTKLRSYKGVILPALAKAWHTPGLHGNGRDWGRGEGYQSNMMQLGFVAVPHVMDCVAFGAPRANPEVSAYLDRYQGVAQGRAVTYYSDAWHRPRRIGHLVAWDFDEAGWMAFLAQCLKLVTPGELDPVQVEIATLPLISAIRAAQDRSDERGKRTVTELLGHLPPEHTPDDLAALRPATTPAPRKR